MPRSWRHPRRPRPWTAWTAVAAPLGSPRHRRGQPGAHRRAGRSRRRIRRCGSPACSRANSDPKWTGIWATGRVAPACAARTIWWRSIPRIPTGRRASAETFFVPQPVRAAIFPSRNIVPSAGSTCCNAARALPSPPVRAIPVWWCGDGGAGGVRERRTGAADAGVPGGRRLHQPRRERDGIAAAGVRVRTDDRGAKNAAASRRRKNTGSAPEPHG